MVNDDGYKAAGIRALYKALSQVYDVTAIAPASEQSWRGKSISGVGELQLEKVTYHGFEGYALSGTPADCTQIGMYELLKDKPDFVVSGINHGANIGHAHILSSGTVGAALEAGLQGVPTFAVSVWRAKKVYGKDLKSPESADWFAEAAAITLNIIEKVMAAGYPKATQVIAINLAPEANVDSPWVVTKPHREHYGSVFVGDGKTYKNDAHAELTVIDDQETDLAALIKGYVSIVPITIGLTSDAGRQELASILDIPIMRG